jgi:hypothetical protein
MTAATTIGIREQAAMILDGDQHARVELRAVHPRLRQVRQDWYTLDQLDALERYAATLAPSYDVWLGAAARARRGGKAEHVAWSAMLWADCDSPRACSALQTFTPAPTLVVRSSTLAEEGEHRQAWWRLDGRLGAEQLEPALRRLAAALSSDTSVCDRPRVLRAVGTLNHKRTRPEPIEVVSCTGEVHALRAVLEALPPDPGTAGAAGLRHAGAGVHVAPERPLAEGEGRHRYLVDWATRLARAGVLDVARLEAHLQLEFELACEPQPPPAPGALRSLAEWAASSRIAERERAELAAAAAGSWWARAPEQEAADG